MKSQQPAEGILKRSDWGNAKYYSVSCSCGNDDDNLEFIVEADETGINVSTYTIQKTDYWTEAVSKRFDIENIWHQEFDWFWKDMWNGFVTRLRLTKNIWWDGYVKYQSTTVMTEQQTLNYAETLKSAVNDVSEFKKERKEMSATGKLAEQGDCV